MEPTLRRSGAVERMEQRENTTASDVTARRRHPQSSTSTSQLHGFFLFFVIVLSIIFLFSYICTCFRGRGDASYNHFYGWE